GFMGSGKSTVGRELAKRLGQNFIEIDRLIEQQAEMRIAEIFQAKGEQGFRDIEEDVIKTISGSAQNSIIACGGGVVIRQINID
ncbi:MAG: shikimate kinase, partial [Dehalococcoidia bacterium]